MAKNQKCSAIPSGPVISPQPHTLAPGDRSNQDQTHVHHRRHNRHNHRQNDDYACTSHHCINQAGGELYSSQIVAKTKSSLVH